MLRVAGVLSVLSLLAGLLAWKGPKGWERFQAVVQDALMETIGARQRTSSWTFVV